MFISAVREGTNPDVFVLSPEGNIKATRNIAHTEDFLYYAQIFQNRVRIQSMIRAEELLSFAV